jgi:hypothetical protein
MEILTCGAAAPAVDHSAIKKPRLQGLFIRTYLDSR